MPPDELGDVEVGQRALVGQDAGVVTAPMPRIRRGNHPSNPNYKKRQKVDLSKLGPERKAKMMKNGSGKKRKQNITKKLTELGMLLKTYRAVLIQSDDGCSYHVKW